MSRRERLSKSTWSVLVTFFLTVASTVAPIPESWRVGIFIVAAFCLFCSCLGWLVAHWKNQPLMRLRRHPVATTVIALSLVLSIYGFYRSLQHPLTTSQWEAEYGHLETISNQDFRDEEIVLDGKQFQDCNFSGVTFVFKGQHLFLIAHNNISGPVHFRIANGAPFTAARLVWETFAEVCQEPKGQWNCPVTAITVRPTEETDFMKKIKRGRGGD